MVIQEAMSLQEKLNILSDAAKYDVACTSSGVDRKNNGKGVGNSVASGICHTFSSDGRCISLMKILLQMSVSLTVGIVSIAHPMMWFGLLLLRRRYVNLPWDFIGEITLRDFS